MKLKVGLVSLVAVLVLAPQAAAVYYVAYPGLHEKAAEQDTRSFLHKNYATWRYKQDGAVECEKGRINRFTWACRVAWFEGQRCLHGRVRITNEYEERGTVYYNAHFIGRRC